MTGNPTLDLDVDGVRCPVWIDARDARCGKTNLIDGRWCTRHTPIMLRRLQGDHDRTAERTATAAAELAAKVPRLLDRLKRLDAEIARLDPAPPTTDTAAYGGVGSTTATAYQERVGRRVPELSRLVQERASVCWLLNRAGVDWAEAE